MGHRLGQADAVVKDRLDVRAGRIPAQEVAAEAGQAADGVELGERRELPGVDPAVRGVQALPHVDDHLPVQQVEVAPVGRGELFAAQART